MVGTPQATNTSTHRGSPPSAIDTIDKVLREHLGSLEATSAAVRVYLALRRVGLLVDPPDSPGP